MNLTLNNSRLISAAQGSVLWRAVPWSGETYDELQSSEALLLKQAVALEDRLSR